MHLHTLLYIGFFLDWKSIGKHLENPGKRYWKRRVFSRWFLWFSRGEFTEFREWPHPENRLFPGQENRYPCQKRRNSPFGKAVLYPNPREAQQTA